MYRQILVAPKDRDCLRFLWRSDSAEDVQEWRLTRVVFGMAPAPYLALRTIQKVIQDYGTSFPLAAEALSHETYVDDILTGADTLEEAVEKKKQLISLLKCGQFELHEWMANNEALVSEENTEGQRSILSHQDIIDEVHLEEKSVQTTNIIVTQDQENDLEVRHSSLTRLLRITAYYLRFIRGMKVGFSQPEVTKELHAKEIQEALKTWIKVIQERAFSAEKSCIELGKPIPPRSSIISLNPFLDEDGLLRVGGRLRNSTLPTQQKHPIVLPRSGHIITLMIRETHEHTLHGGGTLILSILRRRYWILRARNAVRSCIRQCVVCRRYQHPEATQLMGDLPAARVQGSRPFTHTGVDYCGPFDINLRDKNRQLKRAYVAIFVCFATKAVHLEVVMDLSLEAFIGAFRRFTARRGLCTDLYSDRGTNFVGADQQLQYEHKIFCKQIQPALTKELMARGITWHFNPPSAPHFGGLWEAGVKSFKYHLRRVMGRALLGIDEFQTAVTQIEGCLNSRPLTPMSDNPEDVDVLTPGHFIMAGPPLVQPEPTLLHLSPGRLARWQLVQRLVQGFWRRWSSEYLSGLQQKQKWRTKQENMKLNNLVLIKEPNLPPARWRLASIINLHPGADGLVRVLTLQIATSVIQRPIVQVCPLLAE
ncbi:uncharacterized protein LOC107274207 [Cephus cinctus]|uniref:Uncharacterized protein LOC107274207 n=1 Tax=Cephus cinctus TaxID=211228 RepID=A0AAJ7CE21_CEPCN|nr:uncharacterized protein LOC107274207 [Cephus cinctus]